MTSSRREEHVSGTRSQTRPTSTRDPKERKIVPPAGNNRIIKRENRRKSMLSTPSAKEIRLSSPLETTRKFDGQQSNNLNQGLLSCPEQPTLLATKICDPLVETKEEIGTMVVQQRLEHFQDDKRDSGSQQSSAEANLPTAPLRRDEEDRLRVRTDSQSLDSAALKGSPSPESSRLSTLVSSVFSMFGLFSFSSNIDGVASPSDPTLSQKQNRSQRSLPSAVVKDQFQEIVMGVPTAITTDVVFMKRFLGLRVKGLHHGLVVIHLAHNSDGSSGPAEESGGVKLGDVVLSINSQPLPNIKEFYRLVNELPRPLTMRFKRDVDVDATPPLSPASSTSNPEPEPLSLVDKLLATFDMSWDDPDAHNEDDDTHSLHSSRNVTTSSLVNNSKTDSKAEGKPKAAQLTGEVTKSNERRHRMLTEECVGLSELKSKSPVYVCDKEGLKMSCLLTWDAREWLNSALPFSLHDKAMQLRYTSEADGMSMTSLYRKAAETGPLLMLVKDLDGPAFGVYFSQGLHRSGKSYCDGRSFVFTLTPNREIYRWSGKNSDFVTSSPSYIAVGGGNGVALLLEESLLTGRSCHCDTFENDKSLASNEDFQIGQVEVWGFELLH